MILAYQTRKVNPHSRARLHHPARQKWTTLCAPRSTDWTLLIVPHSMYLRDDDPAIRQLVAAIIIAAARPDAVRAAEKITETAEKVIEALDRQTMAAETLRKTIIEIQEINRDFIESSLIESVKTLESSANNNISAIIKSASQSIVKGLSENVLAVVQAKVQNMYMYILLAAVSALFGGLGVGFVLATKALAR